MSPIELIREGILEQNWANIAKAYELLTGEVLGEAKPAMPEEVEEPEVDEYHISNFRTVKSKHSDIILPGEEGADRVETRREPVNLKKIKAVGNLFVDDLTIDAEKRKKYKQEKKNHIPSPRTRPPAQNQVYKCQGGCGKRFEVNPAHVPSGRYVCMKCRGIR